MTKEASDIMLDVYGSGIGSPSLTCICGRHHVAVDSQYLDEGEGESARNAAAKSHKGAYVIVEGDVDSISAACINGNTVVRDCPCGWFVNFERLIWAERKRILEYYTKRHAAAVADSAELSEGLVKGIAVGFSHSADGNGR